MILGDSIDSGGDLYQFAPVIVGRLISDVAHYSPPTFSEANWESTAEMNPAALRNSVGKRLVATAASTISVPFTSALLAAIAQGPSSYSQSGFINCQIKIHASKNQ
ncbi:hypothetical protein Pse7367_3668 (plasmid) [Thalassoporum mexicanum PCC 7367]|nr:hypothetical protein Pse7367_3668 [Pseudanabaena sp. PCC 7367]